MGGLGRFLALPFVVLGLLLQINSPAQATAMAGTMTALETMICADGGGQTTPLKRHHDSAPCSQCVVCAVSPAALLGEAVTVPSPTVRIISLPADRAVAAPRGPPARAANARAPPLSA